MKTPAKKETKAIETIKIESFKVLKTRMFKDGTVSFDLLINGVTINGCIVRQTKEGNDFISLPQRKGSDDRYYSIVYFKLSDADQELILSDVEKMLNS